MKQIIPQCNTFKHLFNRGHSIKKLLRQIKTSIVSGIYGINLIFVLDMSNFIRFGKLKISIIFMIVLLESVNLSMFLFKVFKYSSSPSSNSKFFNDVIGVKMFVYDPTGVIHERLESL